MKFSEQLEPAGALAKYGDEHLIVLEGKYGRGHYKVDFIGQPLTVLTEHLLNIKMSYDTYENNLWWKNEFNNSFDETEKRYFIESQYRHIRFFFFIKLFSVVESQIRILCRKIDSSAVNAGRGNLKDVYNFVFTFFRLGSDHVNLFDFCRLNRNTIHNLGVHTSATQVVCYRNTEFAFEEWKEVMMITSQLQFVLHEDLLTTMIEIKNSKLFENLMD